MNYSILAHTCILNLLKQCWGAPNSIYLQATLEPTILPLHNCYEIWAFFSVELHESNILLYLLKLFVEDILVFFITNTNL